MKNKIFHLGARFCSNYKEATFECIHQSLKRINFNAYTLEFTQLFNSMIGSSEIKKIQFKDEIHHAKHYNWAPHSLLTTGAIKKAIIRQ